MMVFRAGVFPRLGLEPGTISQQISTLTIRSFNDDHSGHSIEILLNTVFDENIKNNIDINDFTMNFLMILHFMLCRMLCYSCLNLFL